MTDVVTEVRPPAVAGAVYVVRAASAAAVRTAVTSLDGVADEVHLLEPASVVTVDGVVSTLTDEDLRPAGEAPAAVRREPDPPGRGDRPTRWVLYSSGTTGSPTPTSHTLSSLTRTIRPSPGRSLTWGLLYEPTRMAGVQVVLHAMRSGHDLVDASAPLPLGERVALLRDGGVDALSATPTTWRRLLQTPGSEALDLRQVTLGGETADQKVLDALATAYPRARVTHVFASTETGAAFSVSDGLAGFPRSYLDAAPGGVRLEVRDGILHVHSPGVASAPEDGFVSTGDVVDVDGDRVHFLGRDNGVVNVGGVKVWPEQVEAALRAHPLVGDALVTARPNPMSGSILMAAVVPAAADPAPDLSRRLRQHCGEVLPAAAVPAVVRVVTELPVTSNGKLSRR